MITVVLPEKPFSYTEKRLPRRKAAYADYESEIDELYQADYGARPRTLRSLTRGDVLVDGNGVPRAASAI